MGNIPNSVVTIPTSLNDFFKHWIEFLSPFHKLTGKEMEVLVALIRRRYELSKAITDDNLLDKILMSSETKKSIKEECKISSQYLQVLISKLRKHNILVDDKINRRFIPNIPDKPEDFRLMLLFQIKDVS